jgi:hypothetical protein
MESHSVSFVLLESIIALYAAQEVSMNLPNQVASLRKSKLGLG